MGVIVITPKLIKDIRDLHAGGQTTEDISRRTRLAPDTVAWLLGEKEAPR
jgi:orotate phosphoribosyltransferase-like protein